MTFSRHDRVWPTAAGWKRLGSEAKDDEARWQRVVLAERSTGAIQPTTGSLQRYRVSVNAPSHTLTLTPADGKGEQLALRYSQEENGRLIVEGNVRGDAVQAHLRVTDVTKFTLRQPLR